MLIPGTNARENAHARPFHYFVSAMLRNAAVMALILSITSAFMSSSFTDPRARLRFIAVWGILMAAMELFVARRRPGSRDAPGDS